MAQIDIGLEGKRYLVLGGGQGMGEATAKRLVWAGASVAVADLEIERAQKVANDITAEGGKAIALQVDVLDDKALVAAIGKVEEDLGPLDGMATVIGMAGWFPLIEMDLDVWDADHRRNLRYFFVAAREVARRLIERGQPGSIVCTASVDGFLCSPGHASYGAAKAGLINLVRSMANEWSEHGVRVNCVAPGAIITPRIPYGGDAEKESMSRIPMGRRGTVDEIAKGITFFMSDLASYVTGQTLAVDGGFLTIYPLTPSKRNLSKDGVMGGS